MQPSATLRRNHSGLEVVRLLRGVNPYVIDGLLALALTLAALATILTRTEGAGDFRNDDLLGGALVLLQTGPLAARRSAPIGVFLVVNVALIASSAFGYEVVQVGTFSSLVSLYGAASLSGTRGGLFAAVFSAGAISAFFITNRGEWGVLDIATIGGTWAIAWLAGIFVRRRGEQVEAAGALASRLEIERDALAREAVADERARMARELHDIVGHALNIIVIQAGGAQRIFDNKPEVALEVLASIESTGREALIEMERMLGVLRASEVASEAGSLSGLSQLDGLAAHVSEAGLPVNVIVEGERRDVPASVGLSAYRIVQESLTNCLKHSGASQATVTIRYRPVHLEIEVRDNGRVPPTSADHSGAGGRGHLGMRERVAMFAGEISIGPSEGGYTVRALLPYESRKSR